MDRPKLIPEPEFPILMMWVASFKSFLDFLELTIILALLTKVISLFFACILGVWTMVQTSHEGCDAEVSGKIWRRFFLGETAELLPFISIVPADAWHVYRTHWDIKEAVQEKNEAIIEEWEREQEALGMAYQEQSSAEVEAEEQEQAQIGMAAAGAAMMDEEEDEKIPAPQAGREQNNEELMQALTRWQPPQAGANQNQLKKNRVVPFPSTTSRTTTPQLAKNPAKNNVPQQSRIGGAAPSAPAPMQRNPEKNNVVSLSERKQAQPTPQKQQQPEKYRTDTPEHLKEAA